MAEVVGVDIGGTKTHLALAYDDDALLRQAVVPTSSWRDVGTSAAALRELIVTQLGEAATTRPLAVGAHGCDSTAQCRALEDALRAQLAGPVTVVNDAELMPPASCSPRAVGAGCSATRGARPASSARPPAPCWPTSTAAGRRTP